jgi:hypothetical protein
MARFCTVVARMSVMMDPRGELSFTGCRQPPALCVNLAVAGADAIRSVQTPGEIR